MFLDIQDFEFAQIESILSKIRPNFAQKFFLEDAATSPAPTALISVFSKVDRGYVALNGNSFKDLSCNSYAA